MNNYFVFYLVPWPSEAKELGNSKMELGGREKERKAENQRVNSAPGSLPSTGPWEMIQAPLMPADSPFGP